MFVVAGRPEIGALGARLYRDIVRLIREGEVLRVGVKLSPVVSSSVFWNSASSVLVKVFLMGGAEIGVCTRTGLSQGLSKRLAGFATRL